MAQQKQPTQRNGLNVQKPETLEPLVPEPSTQATGPSGESAAPTPEVITPNLKDPLEVAAMGFTLYYPKFRIGLGHLNKKELVRLILNLVEKPLLEDTPDMKTENGKTVLAIGEHLLESKWLMKNHAFFEHLEQVQNTEPNEQTEKEETNGET